VFEDECYLTGREDALGTSVPHLRQGFRKWSVQVYPEGEAVRCRIGITSKGAETEEAYDVSLIEKARINFRPGLALSGILTGLNYKRVAIRAVKKDKQTD